MANWTCEACGRGFGRRGQPHVCLPAMTVDQYFAGRAERDREIFEAVRAHVTELGPVDIEAVGVGVFFKRGRTFAELRPRRDGLGLSVVLPRDSDDPRFTRRADAGKDQVYYVVPLRSAADVDDEVRGWLTQSYASSRE